MGAGQGKSYDRVLIYPTTDMIKWIIDNTTMLSGEAKSKFYIGITRARQSVGIVIKQSQQKRFKGKYWDPDLPSSSNISTPTDCSQNIGTQLGLWPES